MCRIFELPAQVKSFRHLEVGKPSTAKAAICGQVRNYASCN